MIANFEKLMRAVDPEIPFDIFNPNVERIQETIKLLPGLEQKVISMRFGLEKVKPLSMKEVGAKLEVTRERVRQIESRAFRKLRHPTLKRLLTDPVNPKSCVRQLITVEWAKHQKPLTWFEIQELAEKLGPSGWQMPSSSELQAAIRDKVPGFTSFGTIKGFWAYSSQSGGQNETYIVKSRGTVDLADKKSKQHACLLRHVSKSGLIL